MNQYWCGSCICNFTDGAEYCPILLFWTVLGYKGGGIAGLRGRIRALHACVRMENGVACMCPTEW